MNPLISIIVPVYNTAHYLPQCLDSLIHQTYSNIEIIAVNDGSTDDSGIILEEYAERDRRIKVITQSNQGLSGARNTGIDYVSGDCILFQDSDDWLDLEVCEESIKVYEENNADLVLFPYIREFPEKSLPKFLFSESRIFNDAECERLLHRRIAGPYKQELSRPDYLDALCTMWGKLYKASIIKECLYRSVDLKIIGTAEDVLFNLGIFQKVRKAVYIDTCFNHYRKNNNSLTANYKKDFPAKYKSLFALMTRYIDELKKDEEFTYALLNRKAFSLMGLGLNEMLNPSSCIEKYKNLDKILKDDFFYNAFDQLELKYVPFPWVVFYYGAKKRLTPLVFVLLWAMNKIIGAKI